MTAAEADAILALVQELEAAVNRRDERAVLDAIAEPGIVEFVAPAELGPGRWEGRAAVRTAWAGLAAVLADASIETEDVFACGERCACRWVLRRMPGSDLGHIRGITAFTVRAGKVARAITYIVT
jgi:hypothetical protein